MNLTQAICKIVVIIINPIITLAFAAALLYMVWGIFTLIMAVSNGEDASAGKSHLLWGIIGMVIMFSVWGIIGVVTGTIGSGPASVGCEAPAASSGSFL